MTYKQGATSFATENVLVITKKGKTLLSKAQQAFNKLNQKIKKLRAEINVSTAYYDECLAYYSTHIYPLEQQSAILRTEVTKLLYNVYCNDKSISKKDRETLKLVILEQIDDVFSTTPNHDDELKKIFNALSGENYDEVTQNIFEAGRSEMENMFSSMGLDIDMSVINKDDDMETIMRKMQEQAAQAKANKVNEEPTKKGKSKREVALEAKEKALEALREQSIKNIYKQLVKALHPDLERNDDLRIEKEALMQELTIAYKNNDLHALLKLELNWIQHESDHLETLTDDKLRIYNQLLKEQVDELQAQFSSLGDHPRYMPLERFQMHGYLDKQALKQEVPRLKKVSESIHTSIHNLKNGKAKYEIATVVASYRLVESTEDDNLFVGWEDFLNDLP